MSPVRSNGSEVRSRLSFNDSRTPRKRTTLPFRRICTGKSKLDAGGLHKTPWPADKKYGVIYSPSDFKTYSEKGTGRSAVAHYDCTG